ncbi:hypothetical protein, partial [Mesorhizobium loti]|uniref:hypothetical protein n=1 Tax=Rhizobium loti TaxID=381 RepID=UPI001AEF3726
SSSCVDASRFARKNLKYGHVIECGHVSGLNLRPFHMPRAGMVMRGSGPNQQSELAWALNLTLVFLTPI